LQTGGRIIALAAAAAAAAAMETRRHCDPSRHSADTTAISDAPACVQKRSTFARDSPTHARSYRQHILGRLSSLLKADE